MVCDNICKAMKSDSYVPSTAVSKCFIPFLMPLLSIHAPPLTIPAFALLHTQTHTHAYTHMHSLILAVFHTFTLCIHIHYG